MDIRGGIVTIVLREGDCAYSFCVYAGFRRRLKGFRLRNAMLQNSYLTNHLVSQGFKTWATRINRDSRERFPAMVRNLFV